MKYLASDTGQYHDTEEELEEIKVGAGTSFYVTKKFAQVKQEKDLNNTEVKE